MTTTTATLPITESIAPADAPAVAEAVRAAHDARAAVYPIGGGTSLDYGLVPTREGRGLELASLAKVVDYTPRDMTIVVEPGVRMADLTATLAAESQHLPIDAPRAAEATIGGLVATNWSGPRRYGYGTLRDYVIGIRAVDGRGVPFKGGGRVVKNVAGYDFCKLLTGSLGTLGVITELTFKVKPVVETAVAVVAECADLDAADQLLADLVDFPAVPAAVDLLIGTAWNDVLAKENDQAAIVVRFEGMEAEAAWATEELARRLGAAGMNVRSLDRAAADEMLATQVEFPDRGLGERGESPLVVRITTLPSAVPAMCQQLLDDDPGCTILAHAASGVVVARFGQFDAADLTTELVGRLRPAAVHHHGSLVVLASTFEGLTHQVVWGGRNESSDLMERTKRQFDPHDILNPGRM